MNGYMGHSMVLGHAEDGCRDTEDTASALKNWHSDKEIKGQMKEHLTWQYKKNITQWVIG